MGLKKKTSHPWNPQSNYILERIYQVLGDGMRIFDLENMDIDESDEDQFDEYLTSVAYAIRSSYHQTHGYSPAQLVYGQDMFLPVPVDVNWEAIKQRKQDQICKNNARENAKQIDHHYNKDDIVTVKKPSILPKLRVPRERPFKVICHHNNGTITIEKEPSNNITMNIRRVEPYYTKTPPETPNNDAE